MAISRPGVEITQEFVTASTVVTSPSLVPVVIGPCYQVVEAINDSGDAVSDALAGTYKDGYGYVSYDLPGLKTDAVVDTSSIRVFLFKGSEYTELNSESDESTITSGTTSTYSWTSPATTATFTDASGDFVNDGVEAGDVIRVQFQGLWYDLEVSSTPAVPKSITVKAGISDASITFSSYSIVRKPAQFTYEAAVKQSAISIGDETNYITFTAQSTGNYAGQAGDDFSVVISESDSIDSGSNGVVGDYLFYTDDDSTKDFTSGVGSVGAVSGFGLYFEVPAEGDAAESTAIVVDVTSVISGNALGLNTSGIDTGEGRTAKNYRILQAVGSDSTDVTGGSEAADAAGQVTGFTSTVWSTVDSGLSGSDYYLEISGDSNAAANGVFHVSSGGAAGVINLSIAGGMTATGGGGTYTLWKVVVDGLTDGDGNSGTVSMFAAPGLSFGSETVTDYDVLVAGTGRTVASVNSTSGVVTLTDAFGGSADALDWSLVETTRDLSIAYSADDKAVTVVLPRVDGASTVSYADLITALTDDTDSNHDADSFVELTAAKNGTGTLTADEAATYKLDGGVDAAGIKVDQDLLGSTTPTGYIYVAYKALRVDVSDQASDAALVSYDTISKLTTDGTGLNPITTDNPLGLGMYLALLNSPNRTVKGLGISATSSAQPMGTTAAWASAAEMLGGQEVYALAPLTDDPEVLSALSTHCTTFSAASEKAERICFLSRAMPGYSSATAVASGTTGNTESTFLSDGKFSTSVDFSANASFTGASNDLVLVVTANAGTTQSPTLAAGAPTVLYGLKIDDYDASDAFVLDIDSDALTALADLEDKNDWKGLVDVAWTVYEVGTALSTTAQTAERVADLGALYASRRSFLVWPPSCAATVSGTTYNLAGYYMGAALAGRVGSESPGQPFTNMSINGFNDLSYSNGYFSESQLDSIAGGGTFIMVQENEGGPVTCRHQLATDVTTIQKRELSITKSIDYVAKTFRNAMTGKIGKFNITQSLMDSLSVQVQGLLRTFVDAGILTSGSLSSIEQNSDNPDTLDIVVLLQVPYPCNYIALTLQI